jgi:hypothetical protein
MKFDLSVLLVFCVPAGHDFFFVFTYILCGYYLKKNDEVKNPIFLKNRIFLSC